MSESASDLAAIELAESIGLLVRRVRAASDAHGLSLAERSVLNHLSREGATTTADLARYQGMKPQSMGTIIAKLQRLGLVRRKPHPTDGRQFNVDLTAKGAAVRRSIREAKETWIAQAVSQLSAQDQKTLFAAGSIIRRMVKAGAEQ
jgi:DNA-binding MarR family transcriptional regulator